jgi:hypothetical protein
MALTPQTGLWVLCSTHRCPVCLNHSQLWTLGQSFEGHKLRSPRCYGCDIPPANLVHPSGGASNDASAAARIVKKAKRAL